MRMKVKCTCTVMPPRPGLQRENNQNGLGHLAGIAVSRLPPLSWLTSFPVVQCTVRVPNWYLESTRVCFQLDHFLQTKFDFSPSLYKTSNKTNMNHPTLHISRFYYDIWLCITYVPWGSGTCNSLYLRRQSVWFAAQPTDDHHSDFSCDFSCRVGDLWTLTSKEKVGSANIQHTQEQL